VNRDIGKVKSRNILSIGIPQVSTGFDDRRMEVYSVRGLERSELGGSHGCPGRLWDRFLWQVYQNDSRYDALGGPVIKSGPKGALGSHEICPIHSAPSLGQSIVKSQSLLFGTFQNVIGQNNNNYYYYLLLLLFFQLQQPQHAGVMRIASAPDPSRPSSSTSAPRMASDPTLYRPPSAEEIRRKLHYHLASIFPEEHVLAAMRSLPEETRPQEICAAILTMFPNAWIEFSHCFCWNLCDGYKRYLKMTGHAAQLN